MKSLPWPKRSLRRGRRHEEAEAFPGTGSEMVLQAFPLQGVDWWAHFGRYCLEEMGECELVSTVPALCLEGKGGAMSDMLKILAVSLMGSQKSKAYAVYNGEQLIVTGVMTISGMFSAWRKPLVQEIEEKKALGYVVLVEEKTDLVSQYATQYLLEDVEVRSNLYEALDWYFALQDMGNLIVDEEAKRFLIRSGSEGQRIEKKQDEKGRPYYDIDWTSFHGGHRAVLLCVVAAMTEPLSDRYIEAMFGQPVPEPDDENPVRRWTKVMAARDLSKGKRLEEEREKKT